MGHLLASAQRARSECTDCWRMGLARRWSAAVTAFYGRFLHVDRILSNPIPPCVRPSGSTANAPAGAVILKEHWEEGLPDLGRLSRCESFRCTSRDLTARKLRTRSPNELAERGLRGLLQQSPVRHDSRACPNATPLSRANTIRLLF